MRILKIRFENLNSLAGEWEIDFTAHAFTSHGIFVVSGPTGAGKTTILDAICLALYGETPRLKGISTTENEIMSRGTSQCSAQATFETPTGRYRCEWRQHRANHKPAGALQAPKRELVELVPNHPDKIVATGIIPVGKMIESISGMKFTQFTRSMMLAQGQFDAFLRSEVNERSAILEQITGTDIYSEISKFVFHKEKEKRLKLDDLKSETASIEVATPEQEETIRAKLSTDENDERERIKKIDDAKAAVAWRDRIDDLTRQIENLTNRERALQSEMDAFKSDRNRMAPAERAISVDVPYAKFQSLHQEQKRDECDLESVESRLPVLVAAVKESTEAWTRADGEMARVKRERDEAKPFIVKIRSLKQSIGELELRLTAEREGLSHIESDLTKSERDRERENAARTEAEADLARAQAYLNEHIGDAALIGALSGIETQYTRLQLDYKNLLPQKDDFTDVAQAEEALRLLLNGKTLEEYREEEKRFILERSLEAHRSHLTDGDPCPLCGSLEHPYAVATNQDVIEPGMIIRRIEELEKRVALLKWQRELSNQLTPFGIVDLSFHDAFSPLPGLRERSDAWASWNAKKSAAEREIAGLMGRRSGLQEVIASKTAERAKALQKIEAMSKELTASRVELETLPWGDKNVDDEERRLDGVVAVAEKSKEEVNRLLQEKIRESAVAEEKKTALAERINQRKPDLTGAETELNRALCDANFANQDEYLRDHLPVQELQALRAKAKTLDDRENELAITKKSRLDDLTKEAEKNITDKSLAELTESITIDSDQLEKIRIDINAGKNRLSEIALNRARIKTDELRIASGQRELDRWAELKVLIGSSNGDKYRTFAQGLTFKILAGHANRHLKQMTDRYLLISHGLAINVIDNYRAGETRPITNLSGGESFIISLALAFGLSHMVSENVRVDSLFLDEGFGTLDEETLNTILDTLTNLREAGKLIGIISHVSALKERIGARIEVTPDIGGTGRSLLAGPGCRKLPISSASKSLFQN